MTNVGLLEEAEKQVHAGAYSVSPAKKIASGWLNKTVHYVHIYPEQKKNVTATHLLFIKKKKKHNKLPIIVL